MYKLPIVMSVQEFKQEKGLLVQSVKDVEALIEAE